MMRFERRTGVRFYALWALIGAAAAAPDLAGQTGSIEPPSTLGSHVPPQNLSLDAAIASMVRRGLLADVSVASPAAPPAARPLAEARAAAPAPAAAPSAPPRRVANRSTPGWRRAGSKTPPASTPRNTPPAPPQPVQREPNPQAEVAAPAWRPTRPAPAPDLPLEVVAAPAEDEPALLLAEPLLLPQQPRDAAVAETPQATLEVDAHETDDLAPIDELPETPAPETDAPGDPREPEIGDQQLEGVLAPAAQTPAVEPPAASSLARKPQVPAGEPDRIERRAADAPAPVSPEPYVESEPPPAERSRLKPLSRNQIALRTKVRRVLRHYYDHPLNTGDRSPWEVMHQMLAFEVHSRIRQESPTGRPVTAVGWLCFNQPCKGRTLMYLNEDGDLRVKVGPALQGHHGQLLALLAQARVRADYPLKVENRDFTVNDLIAMEKLTCYPRTELTFKLLGLQRYLDINARWMNDQGMAWDFPTMLREEMRQPVRTAACGGTHRLSGLILTVKKRQRSGLPVDGAYAEAARFVANYQNYAYRLQNPDGSFSTEWFKGPGAEEDIDRRLKTTGHQLEFMIYASGEQQLVHYRTVKAVNYLANIMWANRGRDWEAGPLGHAIHALVLYDRLVFAPHDAPASSGPVAARSGSAKPR